MKYLRNIANKIIISYLLKKRGSTSADWKTPKKLDSGELDPNARLYQIFVYPSKKEQDEYFLLREVNADNTICSSRVARDPALRVEKNISWKDIYDAEWIHIKELWGPGNDITGGDGYGYGSWADYNGGGSFIVEKLMGVDWIKARIEGIKQYHFDLRPPAILNMESMRCKLMELRDADSKTENVYEKQRFMADNSFSSHSLVTEIYGRRIHGARSRGAKLYQRYLTQTKNTLDDLVACGDLSKNKGDYSFAKLASTYEEQEKTNRRYSRDALRNTVIMLALAIAGIAALAALFLK